MPPFIGLHITIFLGVPLLVIAAAISGQLLDLPTLSVRSYLLLSVSGVIHFVVGAYALYRSFAAIGSNRSAPVRSISVPFSLIMAVILLGERVSAVNGVGIVIVVLAPIIMFQGKSETPTISNSRSAEGYVFSLISGLAFGIAPLLIREAIGGTGMGIAGALVAYSSAAGVLLLGLAWPGRLTSLREMDRTSLLWFLLTAVTVFFAQMFGFLALELAPVTVVTPLMRTAAVWTVIFAFLINRQLEVFSPRILGAIALSIVGSVFVVL